MAAARYWRLSSFTTRSSAYLELSQLELWGGGAKVTASLTCALSPVAGTLAALSDADLYTTGKWLVVPGLTFVFDCTTSTTVDFVRFGSAQLPEYVTSCLLEYSTDALTWTMRTRYGHVIYPGAFALTTGTDTDFDPYSANVTLLLHCDGTDGSTTFADSSASPKTATFYGSAAIRTAQSKFGGASLRLPGSSGVMFPSAGVCDMGGGDFTIELLMRPDSSTNSVFINTYGVGASTSGFYIQFWSGSLTASCYAGSSVIGSCSVVTTLVADTWIHLAYVRNGNNFTLYRDGVSVATATSSSGMNSVATKLRIGMDSDTGADSFTGYIDEVRITKGVARYTTNFTPATDPYSIVGSAAIDEASSVSPTFLAYTSEVISAITYPPGTVQTQVSPPFTMTRLELSGRGMVAGTVKVSPSTPVARRVRLYRDLDGRFSGETWSDPITGAYSFNEVPEALAYTVLSYDHTETFRAVIADRLTPDMMP